MISVDLAQSSIASHCRTLASIQVELNRALNFTLAETVISPINMPPFDQSAMDGYAINEGNFDQYAIIGEIQAGDNALSVDLKPGEAVRIFTGAMVPSSATSVVKQESTVRDGAQLKITESFNSGANIRHAGEQIKEESIALNKGTVLNAGAIGFLAMLGIRTVNVFRKPVVRLLITGNELVQAGASLSPGTIYESNSTTLLAALEQIGITAEITTVKDDFESTKSTIKESLENCDILISTGGISVGDYDFVGKSLRENGITEHFYKVKQKPGKPLFFGSNDSTLVFALPGNPAAALSSFYLYVLPAIRKMMGHAQPELEKRMLAIETDYSKTAALTHFLKGQTTHSGVQILNDQSSAMLSSFAHANCLIRLEEGKDAWKKGDLVPVYILP